MLSKLFTYRPGQLIASILTWTAAFCVPLATGAVTQAVFDHLTAADGDTDRLWALLAGLAGLGIAAPALMVLWFWVHTTFETTLESLGRTNLFRWVIERAGIDAKAPSAATMLGHVRDDVEGHTSLVNEWYRLIGEGVFVVVALAVMVRIDAAVTLLTFLPLAAVVLLTHRLRARLAPLWGRAREETTTVTGHIGDVFSGVQAVKVAGAESAVLRRFREMNEDRRRAEVRSVVAEARLDSAGEAITLLGRGLVLLVGAGAMLEGRFSVGDFVLFTAYLDLMLQAPRRLGRLLGQRRQSAKALERLGGLMGEDSLGRLVEHRPVHLTGPVPEPEAPVRSGDRLRLLDVAGLTYRYPGSDNGIRDVDLRVGGGEIVVVTGALGSGKTTLLRVLLGLLEPDGGKVAWNGRIVDEPEAFMVPPRVAYKPQSPRVFGGTVRENVQLGLKEDDESLHLALEAAGLVDDVRTFESGLDTAVGPRGVKLSGGQRQRLGTARALLRRSELTVIDDFANGLDIATEQALWSSIERARTERDAAFLIAGHRPIALRGADRVIVMESGGIIADGTLDEVRSVSEAARQALDDGIGAQVATRASD